MSSRKRIFIVSDIHGCYTPLKKALDDAGFDEHDEDHLFVCCGDLFDRGRENRKVYNFIKGLRHKVLVRGNHDERLAEALLNKRAELCDLRGGMDTTLEEFFGAGSVGMYGELRLPEDGGMAEELCSLVGGMHDYYETENYVFVHGWIPTVPGAQPPRPLENWREADAAAWRSARLSEWLSFVHLPAMVHQKTIVCGHCPTLFAYMADPRRTSINSTPFFGRGVIAIDGGTVRSGRVNVLVVGERV